MSDPLSVAASVAGILSLGIQATQSLVDFYQAFKHQDSNIAHITGRLDSLLDTFQYAKKTLSDRDQADKRGLVKNIATSLQNCEELVQELQDECKKFNKTSSQGIKATARAVGYRVTYPFRQSTLQKLDEDIDEIVANLSSAMNVLQLEDNKNFQDLWVLQFEDNKKIQELLDVVRSIQISSDLRDWLNAPDATIDHNAACAKKHPGTGMWLVKSPLFSTWLKEENSSMWLNGFAGSGKSVLCSTAIQYAWRQRKDSGIGIAFFYFTFNDTSKQDESAMLRALLLQLSSQLQDGHADLSRLHESHKAGIPRSQVLLDHLHRLIQRFRHVYILLDALDESPSRNGLRESVLDALEVMQRWGVQGLHLFVTSRDESDIRESLNLSQQVTMQNAEINKDIADFISGQLDTNRRLQKWLPYREKIEETLAKRAKGVFRWVECQFKTLQSCPCSEDHLDRLLNSLPRSLDETYERTLCNIEYTKDARRILTLLCFAERPLTVQELIDGIAVDTAVNVTGSSGLNRKRRLQDSNSLLDICGGLIDIGLGLDPTTEFHGGEEEKSTPTVQIAHFSVQEYLESERIRHQKAAIFSLTSVTAHAEIAQICLIYLLENDLSSSTMDIGLLERFPLAQFAAMYWYHHYLNSAQPAHELDNCILRLFQSQDSFATWVKFYHIDRLCNSFDINPLSNNIAARIYYASSLGLHQPLRELINSEQLESTTISALTSAFTPNISNKINAQGGIYGNALQAASYKGYDKVVQMLLDKGAEVNVQGGMCSNALQAASKGGHDKVVQMLLDKGAEVNAEGGYFSNALYGASHGGHEKVVQMLLDKGADINAQGEHFGNALQVASYGGHEKVVQMLLDKGADVNAQGGRYGNALQAVSKGGHEKVVQMLLDKGADVNAQGGRYGNALQGASYDGHEEVVQMLLDKGADVNAQGGNFSNALQAASQCGHEEVVQMLLDKGAEVNAQGGRYGNALQAASHRGHEEVVQMLLDKGAEVNAQGGRYGNALQAASHRGYGKVVQMLLDKGAEAEAQY